MKKFAFLLFISCAVPGFAQSRVFSPGLDRFWIAYDRISELSDRSQKIRAAGFSDAAKTAAFARRTGSGSKTKRTK